jgi:D-amino-acid dehydrogenase
VGVTTAYYLARRGHKVTVIERQAGAALETSFANAGEISPGYAAPWASPRVPRMLLRWLLMEHAPLILRPRADPAMMSWLLAMLCNCTGARYAANKERMVRLARYSCDQLGRLRAETGISYDQRALGTLQLFRKSDELKAAEKDVAVLAAGDVPFELLDRNGCIRVEPGLAEARDRFVGGLRLPNDETGDCFLFTSALVDRARAEGAEFRFGVTALSLIADTGCVTRVQTRNGDVTGDAFVVALGSYSRSLVSPLGLRLPVYPVKGYSITVPITEPGAAPQSTVLDETYKIAITRLGDRVRVGGLAEISGYGDRPDPRGARALRHSLASLFPGVGSQPDTDAWMGLRPMTPDGTPIVGPTVYRNLYLNTGHGTLGWTMACGSGRVISDLIAGDEPEIETRDLGLARYDRAGCSP